MKNRIGEDWPLGLLTLLVAGPVLGVLLYIVYATAEAEDYFKIFGQVALALLIGSAVEWHQRRRSASEGDDANG